MKKKEEGIGVKPQLVIFDMDGLMFDTEHIYYRAWQEAARKQGYEINWDIYKKIVARNNRYIEKVLKEIFGQTLPYDALVTEKRRLSDEIVEAEGLVLKEGLVELLDVLEQKGIKKAVATSSAKEKAFRYLEKGQVLKRFDYIICGDDVVESKPNPEIFQKAAAYFGYDAANCIVLEDSKLGIEAGNRGGMCPLLIPDLVEPDEEMRENAHKVLRSLKEVIDFLEYEWKVWKK